MVTDDERRRVAANLRELAGGYVTVGEIDEALGIGRSSQDVDLEGDARDLLRLADLIEPARGSGGGAILCGHCEKMSWCGCEPGDLEGGCDFEPRVDEGEPPYNLYSLYEAVFKRRPRDEFAIEDDEVRELVNGLLDICNAPGRDLIEPNEGQKTPDASTGADRGPRVDRDALLELAGMLEREAEAMRTAAEGYEQMTMRLMRKVADTFSLVAETVRSARGGRAAGEPEFWRCPFTQGPCDDACMLATTVYATTPDFMDGTPTVDPDRPLGWSCTLRKDAGERYNAPRGEEA